MGANGLGGVNIPTWTISCGSGAVSTDRHYVAIERAAAEGSRHTDWAGFLLPLPEDDHMVKGAVGFALNGETDGANSHPARLLRGLASSRLLASSFGLGKHGG
jgi:hypothetical protein